jgi:hypothetical protein
MREHRIFLSLFFIVLKFKLRALYLLGSHSPTLPPVLLYQNLPYFSNEPLTMSSKFWVRLEGLKLGTFWVIDGKILRNMPGMGVIAQW